MNGNPDSLRRRLFEFFYSRVITVLSGKGISFLNLPKYFPAFAPSSWGSYGQKAKSTAECINAVFPAIVSLPNPGIRSGSRLIPVGIDGNNVSKAAHDLRGFFEQYGSDKGLIHEYHHLYGSLFPDPKKLEKVLEIGIGSNNPAVLSTMGRGYKFGASLRAMRDFFPNAQIYGADIDPNILFQEDRISTFQVDQTNPRSFDALSKAIGKGFDLMVDDGLHSPHANIWSLGFFMRHLKPGGFAVIEDLNSSALDIWRIVQRCMPSDFSSEIVATKSAFVFLVRRDKGNS